MPLSIRVVKYKSISPKENLFCLFDRQEGFIGRSPDNDLVLPDPEKCISRKHAAIKYEKGYYYLTDNSSAGTVITNKNISIHKNTVKLTDGDQIIIGDYDLVVSISEEKAIPNFSSSNNINQEAIDHPYITPIINNNINDPLNKKELSLHEYVHAEKQIPIDFDYSKLLDDYQTDNEKDLDFDFPEIPPPLKDDDQNIVETESKCANLEENFVRRQEPVREQLGPDHRLGHFPPHPLPPGEMEFKEGADYIGRNDDQGQQLPDQIGLDQDLSAGEPQPVTPVASGSTCQNNEQTARELFDIFLKAAGVRDNTLFSPEKISECMGIVGSVFKEMIKGLMVVLRGRAEIKNQFKVEMTILEAANNNPLKFTPNLEDAITLMLLKNRLGFIEATEAVRQGFADIMSHQLATNAGLQASLMALVSRFDPEHFSKKFNEGIVFQKKSKCWDAYCLAYPEIVRNGSNNFFGAEFSRVYEEQMGKLKCSKEPEKESRFRKQDE